MRDAVGERLANVEALKQTVMIPDLIAKVKELKPESAEKLDTYEAKYKAGVNPSARARPGLARRLHYCTDRCARVAPPSHAVHATAHAHEGERERE